MPDTDDGTRILFMTTDDQSKLALVEARAAMMRDALHNLIGQCEIAEVAPQVIGKHIKIELDHALAALSSEPPAVLAHIESAAKLIEQGSSKEHPLAQLLQALEILQPYRTQP